MVKTIQKCRICGNPHLQEILDFGPQWIQGSFVYPDKAPPPKRKVSTKILRCMPEKYQDGCGLVQNLVSIDPRILYSNYGYSSSISDTMRNHLKNVSEMVKQMVPGADSILDIGGNTGELIKNYSAKTRVVVDPSDVAKDALGGQDEIKLINQCYPCELSDTFDVIHSLACLYDIDDLHTFFWNITNHLDNFGIYVFEVAYLPTVLEKLSYDGMVLEHVSLFSFTVLEKLFEEYRLKIFKAVETDTNGGSLLGFACKDQAFNYYQQFSNDLNCFRLKEFELELDTAAPYEDFAKRVDQHKKDLVNILDELKNNGETIHILGSSTKLNVVLQAAGIGTNYISAAAERDKKKIGGFIPNGIPIISEEESRKTATVYMVGPYHFKDELIQREQEFLKRGGKLLFPLPKIELTGA